MSAKNNIWGEMTEDHLAMRRPAKIDDKTLGCTFKAVSSPIMVGASMQFIKSWNSQLKESASAIQNVT